ncbi:MAG: hypothetical protein RIB47_09060 [Cyclobacteriaceae bacterium]
MFIGHFAIGFAAKKIEPKVSLGTYFIAVQLADLLWPFLLLLGVEEVVIAPGITAVTPLDFVSYPISHSLATMVLWAALFGFFYKLTSKNIRGGWIVAICVVSHWVLDWITHRPDMPLFPGNSPLLGLGLWHSVLWTEIVELSIFGAGVFLYAKTTNALNKKGSIGLWSLVIFFLVINVANLIGPPPPSVDAITWSAMLQWLFVIWAFWIDRNREIVRAQT